jgi:hypothetical protein
MWLNMADIKTARRILELVPYIAVKKTAQQLERNYWEKVGHDRGRSVEETPV